MNIYNIVFDFCRKNNRKLYAYKNEKFIRYNKIQKKLSKIDHNCEYGFIVVDVLHEWKIRLYYGNVVLLGFPDKNLFRMTDKDLSGKIIEYLNYTFPYNDQHIQRCIGCCKEMPETNSNNTYMYTLCLHVYRQIRDEYKNQWLGLCPECAFDRRIVKLWACPISLYEKDLKLEHYRNPVFNDFEADIKSKYPDCHNVELVGENGHWKAIYEIDEEDHTCYRHYNIDQPPTYCKCCNEYIIPYDSGGNYKINDVFFDRRNIARNTYSPGKINYMVIHESYKDKHQINPYRE